MMLSKKLQQAWKVNNWVGGDPSGGDFTKCYHGRGTLLWTPCEHLVNTVWTRISSIPSGCRLWKPSTPDQSSCDAVRPEWDYYGPGADYTHPLSNYVKPRRIRPGSPQESWPQRQPLFGQLRQVRRRGNSEPYMIIFIYLNIYNMYIYIIIIQTDFLKVTRI